MKKFLIVVSLILSLLMVLCACKSGNNEATNPATEPNASGSEVVKPTENVTIDWETPIDVDDSFLEETADDSESVTEPAETDSTGATVPQATDPTDPSVDPTDAPEVTEAPTSSETRPQKPGSSGAIELPMIPG